MLEQHLTKPEDQEAAQHKATLLDALQGLRNK
jgi:hypothetical protein